MMVIWGVLIPNFDEYTFINYDNIFKLAKNAHFTGVCTVNHKAALKNDGHLGYIDTLVYFNEYTVYLILVCKLFLSFQKMSNVLFLCIPI